MAKRVRVTADDVHVVYRTAKRVTKSQLDALERTLGAELPRGYRAFLTRFGHGWINDWLQLYCPGAALLAEQREALVRDFLQYARDYDRTFDTARLTEGDVQSAVQIGIDQDLLRLFACPRFPGSVFAWSSLTITRHKTGVERLDPFAAMRMDRFAYFFPLDPVRESRSLCCRSRRLLVTDVVEALRLAAGCQVRVIDVDEGPGPGTRSPAFWLFPEKPGVKLHVYGVETARARRVYLTFGTAPNLVSKVDSLIGEASRRLGVSFEPARWH